MQPSKLVLGRTQPDELNRGFAKLNVAFTLPPGSYATLVVKRLFHRTAREDTPDEIRATPGGGRLAAEGEVMRRPGPYLRHSRHRPRPGRPAPNRSAEAHRPRRPSRRHPRGIGPVQGPEKRPRWPPGHVRSCVRVPCRQLHRVGGNRPASTGV